MRNTILRWTATACLLMLATAGFTATWPNSEFSQLHYGLYWFGYDDNWAKAVPGQANPYYNQSKKTLIYIHGWQNGTTPDKSRETFDRTSVGGPNTDLAAAWLSAGYNVGVLYWNQFADESEVKDAEAKIWTTNGPRGMRWRKLDGSYSNLNTSDNVTRLLYNDLKANMSGFAGTELRIAGHSLGNQVALALSDLIRADVNAGKVTSKLLPKRVALLDPFYSNGSKSYLNGDWAGERSRWAANRLISAGVAIEAYRSSSVTNTVFVGDANTALMKKTAFTELKPWYFQSWEQDKKHHAAAWHYLWSFSFNPPAIKNSSADAASAQTSTSRIKALMSSTQKLVHDLGAYSKSPSDDRFKTASK